MLLTSYEQMPCRTLDDFSYPVLKSMFLTRVFQIVFIEEESAVTSKKVWEIQKFRKGSRNIKKS